jgi:hypothetical protein
MAASISIRMPPVHQYYCMPLLFQAYRELFTIAAGADTKGAMDNIKAMLPSS